MRSERADGWLRPVLLRSQQAGGNRGQVARLLSRVLGDEQPLAIATGRFRAIPGSKAFVVVTSARLLFVEIDERYAPVSVVDFAPADITQTTTTSAKRWLVQHVTNLVFITRAGAVPFTEVLARQADAVLGALEWLRLEHQAGPDGRKDTGGAAGAVFISYAREDRPVAQRLAAALREAGLDVWIDVDRLLPGEVWKHKIAMAIRDGAAFVACYSTQALSRPGRFQNIEINLAIAQLREHPTLSRWFVPVRLDRCGFPALSIDDNRTLNDLRHVDLSVPGRWDRAVADLIAVLRGHAQSWRQSENRR